MALQMVRPRAIQATITTSSTTTSTLLTLQKSSQRIYIHTKPNNYTDLVERLEYHIEHLMQYKQPLSLSCSPVTFKYKHHIILLYNNTNLNSRLRRRLWRWLYGWYSRGLHNNKYKKIYRLVNKKYRPLTIHTYVILSILFLQQSWHTIYTNL